MLLLLLRDAAAGPDTVLPQGMVTVCCADATDGKPGAAASVAQPAACCCWCNLQTRAWWWAHAISNTVNNNASGTCLHIDGAGQACVCSCTTTTTATTTNNNNNNNNNSHKNNTLHGGLHCCFTAACQHGASLRHNIILFQQAA